MLALQKVDCVSQLALSQSIPDGLRENELADFIVRHVATAAPAPAPVSASPAPSGQLYVTTTDQSCVPALVAPYDAATYTEVEQLREKLEAQEERDKMRDALSKQLGARMTKIEKLVPQDKDNDSAGSGGGLVLASSTSEVNAETVNAAAAQAVRPVQQQVVRVEHRIDELSALMTGFIMSHSDPVLKSHLEDLNNEAVAVMKKHDGVLGWQVRYMAVRRGTLFYGNTYKAVEMLSDGSTKTSTDHHVIDLRGCSVRKCQKESDPSHFAFALTTAQVNSGCVLLCMRMLRMLTRCHNELSAEPR